MIISASRRTDIPAYHSDWMLSKIKEGHACVRNPMNFSQVKKVNLTPDAVDCIVFWSKNPEPMLDKLMALNDYVYYFQFTLNPYDSDIEANLPDKKALTETFKRLAEKIGPKRLIWRYDPVLINERYSIQYHIDKFSSMTFELKDFTGRVVFSFIDFYKKINRRLAENNIKETDNEDKEIIAENFSRAAGENKLLIETCAEDIDLSRFGISPGCCIDSRLITELSGKELPFKKDKNQRQLCGCAVSTDIGEYNTCLNACLYCYANNHMASMDSRSSSA